MAATRTVRKSGRSSYQRRHARPALVLFGILALVGAFVWIGVIRTAGDVNANISCNEPAATAPKA